MSLNDVLAGLKMTVNDTISTEEFKPLNKIIEQAAGDKTYIADKVTLDALVSTIGNTGDTGGAPQRVPQWLN